MKKKKWREVLYRKVSFIKRRYPFYYKYENIDNRNCLFKTRNPSHFFIRTLLRHIIAKKKTLSSKIISSWVNLFDYWNIEQNSLKCSFKSERYTSESTCKTICNQYMALVFVLLIKSKTSKYKFEKKKWRPEISVSIITSLLIRLLLTKLLSFLSLYILNFLLYSLLFIIELVGLVCKCHFFLLCKLFLIP